MKLERHAPILHKVHPLYLFPFMPYYVGETSPQSRDGDADTSNDIYPLLFYSFATVGGVLLVAVLVLLAAILMVRYKRQHLLESQLLTKEQKISIMKQTGYVNPTYKFLDMQNDK
jgi:hypothetical protein